MEKAYDVKSLLKEYLEAKGIVVLESGASNLLEGLEQWLDKSAELSATAVDDMLRPGFKWAFGEARKQLDFNKDGKIG